MTADRAVISAYHAHMHAHTPQYATVEKDGEWYMTHGDFVCRYLQLADCDRCPETVRLLAEVADTTKNK